jgi:hypothetical protein
MKRPTNSDDIIDSRDVIEAIKEIQQELESLTFDADDDIERGELTKELNSLTDLQEEGEQVSSEWPHGETLIRDSHFVEYAQQLAEDIGAIEDFSHWPCDCIDWDKAADALKMDYSTVEFDGETYYIRST